MAQAESTIIRSGLIRLGFRPEKFDYIVALCGNPNTGKSTLFNALTGLRQHTGNWPGKTVAKTEGHYTFRDKRYQVVDLPGTYSLLSRSVDEEIASEFLLFGKPDAVCIVVDASRLERNLNFTLQVLQITDRPIVCLNMMDEAEREGLKIDSAALEDQLGVPVVEMVARRGIGLEKAVETIDDVAHGRTLPTPRGLVLNEETQSAVSRLLPQIEQVLPGIPNAEWIALRLLENDERVIRALQDGSLKHWASHGTSVEQFV